MNNNGYISIQQTQKNFFEGRMTACTRTSGVTLPDFIKVAKSFDLPAVRIENKATAIEEIRNIKAILDRDELD